MKINELTELSNLNFKIMGTYSKGANGTFSGKVGSIVGSNWRSVNYLRSLPKKSNKPPTPLQLAQQAKFALAAAQLSPIKDVLNLGFRDKKLSNITGYNAAVRSFLTEAIIGSYPDFLVDFSKLKLSKGTLHGIQNINMEDTGMLTINWVADVNSFNAFADDQLILVIYNETKNMYLINDSFERGQELAELSLQGMQANQLHVWIFCVKRDGNAVSNSHYVGAITTN